MTALPKVLVAERGATRIGIRLALEGHAKVCAEAETSEEAIRAAKREQPDLCLIGADIPGGIAVAVRGVVRAAPTTKVLVLADEVDADGMLDAIRAGAVGYAPGGLTPELLRRLVAAAQAREAVLPRALVLDLLQEVRSGGEANGLTTREAQVLGMVRRGHSTATIADRLEIAPVTVRRHISELVRKLGVASRAELVEVAG